MDGPPVAQLTLLLAVVILLANDVLHFFFKSYLAASLQMKYQSHLLPAVV